MKAAIVVGTGVAGLTVAHLLRRHGWRVGLRGARERGPRVSRGPTLVVRDATLQLLCDVWGIGIEALPSPHRLTTRIVHTAGADPESRPRTLVDSGWTIAAGALQDCLRDRLGDVVDDGPETVDPEHPETWHVDASGRSATPTATGGRRTIVAVHGDLQATADDECWSFESVPEGWLLVAPFETRRAIVQLMVPAPCGAADVRRSSGALACLVDRAMAASRLARATVSRTDGDCETWHAAPAFTDPWPAPRTLRVGDSAMAFDPICGDGTGHAVRGAVLATAALTAIEEGLTRGDAVASDIRHHYRQRLRLAFADHLHTCIETYASLTPSDPWADELRHMAAVHDAFHAGAPTLTTFRYRLVGSRLVPSESPANIAVV